MVMYLTLVYLVTKFRYVTKIAKLVKLKIAKLVNLGLWSEVPSSSFNLEDEILLNKSI